MRLYDAILDSGWEKAAAALDADAKLNPNSEFLTREKLEGVGSRLLNNGKKTEAVALFERIVRDSPTSAEAYATLADAYAQTGQKEKAIAALKQALAVLPKDPDVPAGDRKAWQEEGQKRIAELSK
jgi:Flp pilus assembly protein TadD